MLKGGAARTLLHCQPWQSSPSGLIKGPTDCFRIASLVTASSGAGRPSIAAMFFLTLSSISGMSPEKSPYACQLAVGLAELCERSAYRLLFAG